MVVCLLPASCRGCLREGCRSVGFRRSVVAVWVVGCTYRGPTSDDDGRTYQNRGPTADGPACVFTCGSGVGGVNSDASSGRGRSTDREASRSIDRPRGEKNMQAHGDFWTAPRGHLKRRARGAHGGVSYLWSARQHHPRSNTTVGIRENRQTATNGFSDGAENTTGESGVVELL